MNNIQVLLPATGEGDGMFTSAADLERCNITFKSDSSAYLIFISEFFVIRNYIFVLIHDYSCELIVENGHLRRKRKSSPKVVPLSIIKIKLIE